MTAVVNRCPAAWPSCIQLSTTTTGGNQDMEGSTALPLELLDLAHFFSPQAQCPSRSLPFRRLALFGPCPPSTPLQLALASAAGRSHGRASVESHSSTDVAHRRHVLLLCSSRPRLLEGTVLENAENLAELTGGDSAALDSNVEIRFLDTMARWIFFCSAFDHPAAAMSTGKGALTSKKQPDLVIVSGLSAFLAEKRNTGAGVETYGNLVAATLAAFPSAQCVFLDDPDEGHTSLPLLPQQHRAKLRQVNRDKNAGNDGLSPAKSAPNATGDVRSMPLRNIMQYFCDAIGEVTAEGGTEDVLWYNLTLQRTGLKPAPQNDGPSDWQDIDLRYAVHKGFDETGYSGRERWAVHFN